MNGPRVLPKRALGLETSRRFAMPEIHKEFCIRDLTTVTADGRYEARAAVMPLGGSRTQFQRFLDFETFGTKEEATARAIAGARAWIDEEMRYVPFALPNVSKAEYR